MCNSEKENDVEIFYVASSLQIASEIVKRKYKRRAGIGHRKCAFKGQSIFIRAFSERKRSGTSFSFLRSSKKLSEIASIQIVALPALGIKARYVFWKTKRDEDIYRRYNWNERAFLFIPLERWMRPKGVGWAREVFHDRIATLRRRRSYTRVRRKPISPFASSPELSILKTFENTREGKKRLKVRPGGQNDSFHIGTRLLEVSGRKRREDGVALQKRDNYRFRRRKEACVA